MSERFDKLIKVPAQPALRLMAAANAKLEHKSMLPASASVTELLAEMEEAGAQIDMLRLMSACLPAREAVWWAVLAGQDLVAEGDKPPQALTVAEQWVRKPTADNRQAARSIAEHAEPDDDTVLCAVAVAFHDGKLGDGDLANHDAPPGATAVAAFGMNMIALNACADRFNAAANVLIDRAVDIARGGPGRIPMPEPIPEPAEDPEE